MMETSIRSKKKILNVEYSRISGHLWNAQNIIYTLLFIYIAFAFYVNSTVSAHDFFNNTTSTSSFSRTSPTNPQTPSGLSTGFAGSLYTYSTSAADPDGDRVKYTIDWGDGATSDTLFSTSGTASMASHVCMVPGTFNVTAKATDNCAETSNWSDARTVKITVKVCC